MPEDQPNTPPDPAQQLRQHLDSLRAAGVEWLPSAPPPEKEAVSPAPARVSVAAPTAPAPRSLPAAPALQANLFASAPLETQTAEADEERRRHSLTVLAETVSKCQRCGELWSTRSQTVFGIGPLNPDLAILGEAPGRDEDEQGEPFVGAAGQLLNRIIAACGMRREEVYILNILKCRPPSNRTPLPEEADNCREYLEQQIELVRPKFLCAMGKSAVNYLLGVNLSITRIRGSFREYRGIPVMCTFHPSYLLRTPEAKKDVWEDMKKLLARMGRPVPGKGGG